MNVGRPQLIQHRVAVIHGKHGQVGIRRLQHQHARAVLPYLAPLDHHVPLRGRASTADLRTFLDGHTLGDGVGQRKIGVLRGRAHQSE